MRHQLPVLKCLSVLALAGLLTAGSLGSVLASQACRHMARHHAMAPGATDGPCWCDQMTGGGMSLQPVVEAIPPAPPLVASPVQRVVVVVSLPVLLPDSPTFPPTPPPPNGRPS